MTDQIPLRDGAKLPSNYRESQTIDFKKDRKFAIAIQAIFVAIAVMAVIIPLLFSVRLGTTWSPILTIPATFLAALIYMAVHEATHGVMLQVLTKVKPSYRVRFPFLTTGNRAYLTRRSTAIVALAPAVLWGVVLSAVLLTIPADFQLTAYILLALNFAGSSGDFVETFVVERLPRNALVKDDGNKIRVFLPQPL